MAFLWNNLSEWKPPRWSHFSCVCAILLQNKSVGVWRYTHIFWKVLCTHFFRKCLELYRGNIFQVFVELQWDSFEIIYPIENLHVEAFLAVFTLFFYQIPIICKKWATFWSTDAKNLQINFCPLIFSRSFCENLDALDSS